MKSGRELSARLVTVIGLLLYSVTVGVTADQVPADARLQAALCEVVYPVDQFPSAGGYPFIFFGNAFFINEEGYLVTAAHVLSWFRNGGQPYILVGPREGPGQVLKAILVAADWEHDVAVLRATPNPFQSQKNITYLLFSADLPNRGSVVLAASLRPREAKNAHSLDPQLEDLSRGEVLDYQFHRENGVPETELILSSQQVLPGQSGSPLVSMDSHGVVGIVVGQWLLPTLVPSAANGRLLILSPAAALRTHYAIGLLEQLHIPWHVVSPPYGQMAALARESKGFSAPAPVSVVATPYPHQALFGGEVQLDALVDSAGTLTDVRVVKGIPPFLEPALRAVHTWSFSPARANGLVVEARIGIVFQFPQSFLPRVTSREHRYDQPLANASDRGALPVVTIEADYPIASVAEGSVILYESVDSQGQVTSTSILRSEESLTAPTVAALHQWKFVPGKQGGTKTDSAVVVVVTFRRPAP